MTAGCFVWGAVCVNINFCETFVFPSRHLLTHAGDLVNPHCYRQQRPEVKQIATVFVVASTGRLVNLHSFATSVWRFSKSPAFEVFAASLRSQAYVGA